MKRKTWRSVLAAIMAVVLMVTVGPGIEARAVKEMKTCGVAFQLSRGLWLPIHTYLPYYNAKKGKIKVYDQKLSVKLTKYKDELLTNAGGGGGGTDQTTMRKITATLQVQIPTSHSNEFASGISRADGFDQGTKANDVLTFLDTLPDGANEIQDYFDVVVVDYVTGENLLNETTTDGYNYHNVEAKMVQDWRPITSTPVDRRPSDTYLGSYYEEYFAVVEVTAPADYDRICIGVAGIKKQVVKNATAYSANPSSNYIDDFNQSFYEGYATFSNSAYWKKGDKLLSNFLRADKRKVPTTTTTR